MVSSRKDIEEESRKSRLRYILNVYEKQLELLQEFKITHSQKILKDRIREIKSELGEE